MSSRSSDSVAQENRFSSQRVAPLRDLVYDAIRDAIFDGVLVPGERVKEQEIAQQMDVSTTPVKEALRRLEQEGLIVSAPRKGAVVSRAAVTSIEEIIEIRAAIDGLAARFAAVKMTERQRDDLRSVLANMDELTQSNGDGSELEEANANFHRLIRDHAGNGFLVRFMEALEPFDRSVRHLALSMPEERQRGFNDHAAISASIVGALPDEAESLMRAHIRRTLQVVVTDLRSRDHHSAPLT